MEAALVPSHKDDLVGRLKSPEISQPADVQQCATFWYVHNGATFLDKLIVYGVLNGDYGNPLWKEKGEVGGNSGVWFASFAIHTFVCFSEIGV